MNEVELFLKLLWGSVLYRPYVYAFLICFLCFATYHMGAKRMLTFFVSTYLIAYLCEYSSTRNGFPFGMYTYVDDTRTRELWISNVPFWDSLSFVFLSYFSFVLAAAIQRSSQPLHQKMMNRATPWIGGILMTLLDVVIDPLALQGNKWFLGEIYHYPHKGFYFGVTAANFAGWFFVGFSTQWFFQHLYRILPWCHDKWRYLHPNFIKGVLATYAGVFFFNLGITIYIQDYLLILASTIVTFGTLVFLIHRLKPKFKKT